MQGEGTSEKGKNAIIQCIHKKENVSASGNVAPIRRKSLSRSSEKGNKGETTDLNVMSFDVFNQKKYMFREKTALKDGEKKRGWFEKDLRTVACIIFKGKPLAGSCGKE